MKFCMYRTQEMHACWAGSQWRDIDLVCAYEVPQITEFIT